jgi:Fe-S oxidoreductase
MVKVLKVTAEDFRVSGKKVAYHVPCHLCRGLDVVEEPRDLMRVAGLEYIPAASCRFQAAWTSTPPGCGSAIWRRF